MLITRMGARTTSSPDRTSPSAGLPDRSHAARRHLLPDPGDGHLRRQRRDRPGSGITGPIAPGTYRNLRIPNGGTLLLSPGTYRFCAITAGRNVTIRTTGGTATTINAIGSVKLGNESFLGPDAGTPRPTLNAGGHQVRLGAGTIVDAFVSAPNARMSMGRAARLAGTFCVDRLNTDHSIVLQCQ